MYRELTRALVVPLAVLFAAACTDTEPTAPSALAPDPTLAFAFASVSCDATVVGGESIQAAINVAAAGATICVEAGYYEENDASWRDLNIDKSLSLIGAGSGQTIVGLSSDKTNGVEVRGAGIQAIVIEGFTFTRRPGHTAASDFNLRFGETATTFDNLVLRDIEVAWAKARNVYLDGNGTYHDVVVENSSFHNGGVWGFAASGIFNGLSVTDSNFDDNGWNLVGNGIGLDIDASTQATNVSVKGGSFSRNDRVGINLTNIRNSTFSGFTATGNGSHGVNLYEWRDASSNVTFEDCTANGNRDGIQIARENALTVDDVTVQRCVLNDNKRAGIHVWGYQAASTTSAGISFQGNHAEGNQRGIWVQFPTQWLDITGNTTIGSGQHGITVFTAANATIADNIAMDNTFSGVIVLTSTAVAITGNAAARNGGAGILVGADGGSVSDNTIEDNEGGSANPGGLNFFTGTSGVTATGNRISGNVTGIHLMPGTGTGNAAHQNCIKGNDTGAFNASTTSVLDAINNWWGAADGPSGDGPGSGDSVSDGIDFDPWLASCPLDPPPSDPATKDDCKNGGWGAFGFRNHGLCIMFVHTGRDTRNQ